MATKKRTTYKIKFHPKANKKLVQYAKAMHKEMKTWEIIREMERRLGVNHKYISNNLTKGISPSYLTDTGRAARKAMFMREIPPRQHKAKAPGQPTPEWMKLWRKVPKQVRDTLLKGLMTNKLTVIKKR